MKRKRRQMAILLVAALVLSIVAVPGQKKTAYAGSYEESLVAGYDLSSAAGVTANNVSFEKLPGEDTAVARFKGTGNNTSYIKLPNTAFSGVNSSTGLTISVWFQVAATTAEWSRLFDFGYSDFGSTMPFLFLTPTMRFSYNSNGGNWLGTETLCDITGDTQPESGVWNHAVVSLTSTDIHLYLNGNLIGEGQNDNTAILNHISEFNSLDLGRSKFAVDSDYVGYMKDVSIYKTVLTAEDVASMYQGNGGTGAINTPSPYVAKDMNIAENSDNSITFPSAPTAYTNDYKGRQNVHDPSMIKVGNEYYMYSTGIVGTDIEIRRSSDMVHWNYVGGAGLMPANSEVASYVSSNLWAPEVIKVGNEYRMYYSCSGVSGGNSCIALATAANPAGPFTHKGIVVTSTNASWVAGGVNAIDANIIQDENQNMYMVWGSFFGGIKIAPMNAETGYLKTKNGTDGTIIAKRSSSFDNGACEGPFVFYNEETKYYYLVVSYGNLTNEDRGGGGYSMRVGRSKSITGPYLDYNGRAMTDTSVADEQVGYKLATNYKFTDGSGWMSIGGNSIYKEDGKFYCVAHARVNGQRDTLFANIRQMFWTEDGWPLCNPSLYAGETEQKIPVQYVPGKYERIEFSYTKEAAAVTPKTLQLYPNYTAAVNSTSGTWEYAGDNMITVTLGSVTEKYKIVPSWDWEKNRATYTIAGVKTDNGLQRWGKKVAYYTMTESDPTPTPTPTVKPGTGETDPTPTPTPTVKPGTGETDPTPTPTPSSNQQQGTTSGNIQGQQGTLGEVGKPVQPLLEGSITIQEANKTITNANTDKGDPKGSIFSNLMLKGKGANKAVKLSWKKVKGADGYIIYGSACGKKMKKITTLSAKKKSYNVKKLKKGKYYKYIVAAYQKSGEELRVISWSKSVHVCTNGGKKSNPIKVTAKKKLTIQKGKSQKLKPKMKVKKKVTIHIAKFRYEIDNTKIATVNKKGKIKAKKKGSCNLYIYLQNGLYTKVKVKVK